MRKSDCVWTAPKNIKYKESSLHQGLYLPVANFLNLLPNLVAPKGDEEHYILTDLPL